MIFNQIFLEGPYTIDLEKKEDFRGSFTRTFDKEIFKKYDIDFDIVQTSISENVKKNILRGMHYQDKPFEEDKIVHCIRGSIYDVILDIREGSPTKDKWQALMLNDNCLLYIPRGFAHGYQTLESNTSVLYYMNEFYHPECAKTIHYMDTKYKIRWMFENPIMSDKDR